MKVAGLIKVLFARKSLFSVALPVLLGTAAVEAQTTIRGIVVDLFTEQPVSSALVSLRNSTHRTIAGPDGKFEIERVPSGSYILEVAHVRYKRRFHVFTVDREPQIRFRVELEPIDTIPHTSTSVGRSANTVITGRVLDQETEQPIPLVNVILRDTHYGAATDSAGNFEIRGILPDLYILEFRHVAYKTRLHFLPLGEGQTVKMDVALEPQPIPLPEVTVRGNAHESKKLHQTYASTIVTEEQITRMGARTLTDILRTVEPGSLPGFSPRGGRRISNLERVPFMIFLDGTYVAYITGALDNIVDVQQIERIEISRWVGVAPNFGPGTSDRVLQIFTKKAK